MSNFFKAEADTRGILPGMTFETTLLGTVDCFKNQDGVWESVIPDWLQAAAHKSGFAIVSADYKRNTYTLRVLPSNAKAILFDGKHCVISTKRSNKMKNQKGFTLPELIICAWAVVCLSVFCGIIYVVFHFAAKS